MKKLVNRKNKASLDLSIYDDAFANGHQFISNNDKMVLYERWREMDTKRLPDMGVDVSFSYWGQWQKVVKPYRMDKAWHKKDLTLESLILGTPQK